MIFAAKTTASGLVALLVAFTFNLDQPQWALLTVFIVSQPQESGLVLAKSFYRLIGTLVGAAVARLLRWLSSRRSACCSSGRSRCGSASAPLARNTRETFTAYGFVLSGYT